MTRGTVWIAGIALLTAPGCGGWGSGEVQAAAPEARPTEGARTDVEAPSLRAPRLPRQAPAPDAPAPVPDSVASLAEVIERIEAEEPLLLTLSQSDFLDLFRAPLRENVPGPYALHAALDVLGDTAPEMVVAISQGWFGECFWICLFEQDEANWRLRAHVRMDGPCRGLPEVEVVALESRRWIRVEWHDGFSTPVRTDAVALLELAEEELVPVLTASRDGYRPGAARVLSVSYQLQAFDLVRADEGVEAQVTYGVSAGAQETELGRDLWAGEDVVVRLRQLRPGEPFALVEPRGARAVDLALFDTLASAAWLREHAELTGRLALEGTADQKLVLLRLAEQLLDRGGSAEARTLIAVLPPRAELEAAAAAAVR